jgi:hypothetical protein
MSSQCLPRSLSRTQPPATRITVFSWKCLHYKKKKKKQKTGADMNIFVIKGGGYSKQMFVVEHRSTDREYTIHNSRVWSLKKEDS